MDTRTEKRRRFIINAAYWAVILALLYFFFGYVIGWLLPLLIGLVVARLLNPAIRFVSRKTHIPRKPIAFLTVILFLAVIGTLLLLLGTILFRTARDQIYKLPGYYHETLLPALQRIEHWFVDNLGEFFTDWETGGDGTNLLAWLNNAVSDLPSAFGTVFNLATQTPAFLLRVMFTVLFSLFASVYYEEAGAFVMRQLPEQRQQFLRDTFVSFKHSIVSYYGAYLKIMAVAFAELLVGLTIVRGTFSILPALAIAFVDFLPVLGCGVIMFPWALIHLITGNTYMAVGIMIVYLVVFVVRQFIEPKIVGDQLGINPLLTLTAMYVGFLSMGVLGMILLPIVVTIIVDLQKHEKIKLVK
ncbi:MAG: sporulation integral membrane protein YtvI [Oscillospiraceae bacterium]|jgi:sporulation integral membrane protein YtvI|nr:sporulation integral membrane protein YtvI [Oscillospiraceae bacterium]